ncbi:hypothetical protein ACHWQZ_G003201 [Mnemiopsis leidyi]
MRLPSEDMAINTLVGSERAWYNMENYTRIAAEHFEGERFGELLRSGGFDLVLVEDSATIPAIKVLVRLETPIIAIMPLAETKIVRQKYALPGLMNSEPSMLNDITGNIPPSLIERLRTLYRTLKIGKAYIPYLINLLKDDIKQLNKERSNEQSNELSKETSKETSKEIDFTEYMAVHDVVFILDHPAYSFPYLTPPNTFYLGVFHLQDRSVLPLHDIYTSFIAGCPHRHLLYLSFGSYLKDLTKFDKAVSIVRALADMDVCVIVKTESDIAREFNLPSYKILSQPWIPQKDLLGSAKVDLFISHCGNNGRLESLYYNVPLLCVPLFLDQLHNARLVQTNGFGRYIMKEQVSQVTVREVAGEMLGTLEELKERIRRATDVVVNDPGAGISALKFYTDLLVRDPDHAGFLINKIIMKQSSFEVNNLDIILVIFLVIVGFVCAIFVYTCRFFKFCCRKVSNLGKFKTE